MNTEIEVSPLYLSLDLDENAVAQASVVIEVRPLVMHLEIAALAQTQDPGSSDIWGSRIASLAFTLAEDNEAFRRPTLARGQVLRMVKLGTRCLIFSSDGIDSMQPGGREVEIYWNYEHLSDIGLLSSWALTMAGENECWFLDSRKHLIQVGDRGFIDHECSQWFTEGNYVLSYDAEFKLIYISGQNEGWAFDIQNRSLGGGLRRITGLTTDKLSIGQEVLTPGLFEITTNWYDFGSRAYKSIRSVEFSVDTIEYLEAALDFRYRNVDTFKTTPWKRVNPSGIAYVPCYGLEFRVKLRSNVPQHVHLDNIRVMGTLHGYDFLNAVGWAPNANPNM